MQRSLARIIVLIDDLPLDFSAADPLNALQERRVARDTHDLCSAVLVAVGAGMGRSINPLLDFEAAGHRRGTNRRRCAGCVAGAIEIAAMAKKAAG